MLARVLASLDNFNVAHPWSHNEAYAHVVLRQARKVRRAGGSRALDVGCGTGYLVARLARELREVVGLEADPTTASIASDATSALPNVQIRQARFPAGVEEQFDLVSMIAVLHHMPLESALQNARRVLAPQGRLVIVGAYRETRADLALSTISLVLNPLVGAIRHPRRADRPPRAMTVRTTDPVETFPQIASALRATLPGASIRRGLFWRYVAIWEAAVR